MVIKKNQNAVGLGTVGFDICEIPFSIKNFDSEKSFMLSVINGVKNKLGWQSLGYAPNIDLLFPVIKKFEQFINKLTIEDIKNYRFKYDIPDIITTNCQFSKCSIHKIFITDFGCQICTDL